jgi:hypothetical protein
MSKRWKYEKTMRRTILLLHSCGFVVSTIFTTVHPLQPCDPLIPVTGTFSHFLMANLILSCHSSDEAWSYLNGHKNTEKNRYRSMGKLNLLYEVPLNAITRSSGKNWLPTFLWYDMDGIENGASNNSSTVVCIRCHGNRFTELIPSNNRGVYTYRHTDWWEGFMLLRWAQVP